MSADHRRAMVEHLSAQLNAELAKPAAPIIPEPGLHKGVPYEVYKCWDAINYSVLKLFAKSPAHAREEQQHPKAPSEAMEFGRLAHLAILEPERFESEVVVVPENAPKERRSKVDKKWWADFELEHADHEIVKRHELVTLHAMKEAVWAHPVCRKFLSAPGLNEASFAWTDPRTGQLCKAREDMLREVDAWAWALNMKSTKDGSRTAFGKQLFNLQFHEAAAFYVDGMKALGQEGIRFAFLVVEKERPFGCAVWELEDASLALGRARYREYLRTYAACVESGEWPGYSPDGADYVAVPAYAQKDFADGD